MTMLLSARNKVRATVTAVNTGDVIANVELDASGTRLVASITVEAANELGLSKGSDVIAVIKASDVMLATAD
jgi:molybdopterin-binding protein